MNESTAFPELELLDTTEQRPGAIVTLTHTALAPLRAIERDLRALAERYRDVAFDLKTPKGLAAMKAARHDLRENGRYLVQRAMVKCKDEANAAKKAVDQEAVRLVAIIAPRETDFDTAIAAREAELAAEKAERDRIEAERVAKHRAGIERIRSYVAQAQGKTAEQLRNGLGMLQALSFGDEWQEFAAEAAQARGDAVKALAELHTIARERESEAARIEAQRIEQARVAAEQAERQRRLDEQAAELKRQADEISAVRAAEAQRAATASIQAAAPAPPPAPQPAATPLPTIMPTAAALPKIVQPTPAVVPTLKVGEMSRRLGFSVSGEFVEKTLGFAPASTVKAWGLWQEAAWPLICKALADHVLAASITVR
jgi:hypothetical protein